MTTADIPDKKTDQQPKLRAISTLDSLELATIDELTDIPNRRGFTMMAKNALGICERHEIPATLLFFNLDDFQPITDTWGQDEGNHAQLVFSAGLKSSFRCSDPLARLGGGEFAVLLTGTGMEMSRLVIEKFGEALSIYNRKAGLDYDLCFNSGIAEYDPEKHLSVDALLADAGANLEQVKKQGIKAVGQRASA